MNVNRAKRILIIGIILSLIFCCFIGFGNAAILPKIGIYNPEYTVYNPSQKGWISYSDGDYYAELSKFYQVEFFGDDIATNIMELKQRYDIIVVNSEESKISVAVENNFTQFVSDGGGLFVTGALVGWKYPNGTKRAGNAFCKDVLGISRVREFTGILNVTFDSEITDEKCIGNKKINCGYYTLTDGEAFAWKEGTGTIVGVKNEYGRGRGIYYGSPYIGETLKGEEYVNFTVRDEFVLKIFNWINGGDLSISGVTFYPLPNSHDSVVFWTIDDNLHYFIHYNRYKNISRDEVFEWMGCGRLFTNARVKDIITNHNTAIVGLHPGGISKNINRNSSKSFDEVQNDTEQYIEDSRDAWSTNMGYSTSITGWRSPGFGFVWNNTGIPEYPAFMNAGNITWTSEFHMDDAGYTLAQFPFNIVSDPENITAYDGYNSTTFTFLAYHVYGCDGGYAGGYHLPEDELNDKIVGWTDICMIPQLNESMMRHTPMTVLSHAGVAFRCENCTKEVEKFLAYTRGKNVLFSDHDTFTSFWNTKNNVNLSCSGSNITVQAQDAIRGLTLRSKENISSAKIGNDYLIFLKDDRVVLPEMKAGDTFKLTIQDGSYNNSIPRISSITTTHPVYVLNATYSSTDRKISLILDLPYLYKSIYGSKPACVSIENFKSPFLNANNTIFPTNNLTIYANLSGETNITSIDMSVNPSSLPVNITINDLVLPQSINFTAFSTNGNNVTFVICSLISKGRYVIKRDGDHFMTETAGNYGCIKFNNSEWLKSCNFTVELVSEFDTGPGTYPGIRGIHNNTITRHVTSLLIKCTPVPALGLVGTLRILGCGMKHFLSKLPGMDMKVTGITSRFHICLHCWLIIPITTP
jgi:hypothetical protein